MAGVKISALPAIVTPAVTDVFPVVQAGVTYKMTITQLGSLVLLLGGGTMTGALILNTSSPTTDLQAASKGYVDSVASGLNIQPSVVAASVTAFTVTYSNGVSGVGATLTNAGAMAAFSIDGQSPTVGQRILIKNQASTFQNGIYTVTTVGSGAVNWVLTRATDYDTPTEITPGDFVLVLNGTVNAQTQWVQTATVTTVGTDAITWDQFGADINSIITSIQNESYVYVLDTGAANAYVATLTPPVTSYVAGQRISLKIANANLTTTPTVNVNGLGAKTIILTNGAVVPIGAMPVGMIADLRYNGTNYELLNPALVPNSMLNLMADQTIKGNVSGGSAVPVDLSATQVRTMLGVTAGGNYLGSTIYTSGTNAFTPNAAMTKSIVTVLGAGGGGGGVAGGGGGTVGAGGGGSGGYAIASLTRAQMIGAGTQTQVNIGALGAGGTAGANTGSTGGTTTVIANNGAGATLVTCAGGVGGTGGTVSTTAQVIGSGTGGAATVSVGTSFAEASLAGSNGLSLGAVASGVNGRGGNATPFGSGGGGTVTSGGTGANAVGFGAGGGGAFSSTASNFAGGNGVAGMVRIDEYS